MIFFLGACSLAPEYERPEAPVDAAWPTGAAYEQTGVASGQPSADIPWREFITDDRLRQVIETALDNNRDLRIAALNVERARAIYGIQRAELLPAVSASASGIKQRVPADLSATGKATTQERYDVELGIASWEIDFFGRIRSLKDRSLEEYLATEEARRSAQILLVSEVARAYLAMAADQENLELARTTLETQKEAHFIVKRRYEVGVATELDRRRSQTQVETARRDVALYTQFLAQDRNALDLLVGSPVPETLLPPELSRVAPPEPLSPGLPSEVLLERPDILVAEHRLKGANANIGAARAALFPRISLTTSVGTASAELSGLFGSGSETWLFAPQAAMPIFDARLWSALDAVKAEQQIAVAQYERAIQAAFREVADALAVSGTVEEQVSAQQAVVEADEETYRLSVKRYDKGLDSYLNVLDAQRSLYLAQRVLVALELEKQVNRMQLYAVLGGGAE
ncbi:MAG: efflux transporter outer membrane subunit [Desulfobacterales bacterium]|nr:efflux transporter outer membrane subunit [Desulfobacterales bacterium]